MSTTMRYETDYFSTKLVRGTGSNLEEILMSVNYDGYFYDPIVIKANNGSV